METTMQYLEKLTKETKKGEAELMTKAFQVGFRELWREHVLGRYLRKEITRDDAIEAVGIDWVELAERQRDAVLEDISWAFGD